MVAIRPVVLIGIGPLAERTVDRYLRVVGERYGRLPTVLSLVVEYAAHSPTLRQEQDGLQRITLPPPTFDRSSDWPDWLPPELQTMLPAQRAHTRAWMRAAWVQRVDDLHEFLLETVPALSSFAVVEDLKAKGLELARTSELYLCVVADLGDVLGSAIAIDAACLVSHVCRQLGFTSRDWGLLFLPSATSPAPTEEAAAYAALKELECYARGHVYEDTFLPQSSSLRSRAPFDDGCYLLDSVNEAGYTIQDEKQLVTLAGEWLYAMTFQDMASAVRARQNSRYRRAKLKGRSRVFRSFGLSTLYVPRSPLLDWSKAHLGATVVQRVMNGQSDVDPDKRARALIEWLGLGLEELESRFEQHLDRSQLSEALAPLYQTRLKVLEFQARQVLQKMRLEYLPALGEKVRASQEQIQQEVQDAVEEEVRIALEDTPVGGLSLAHQILDTLGQSISDMRAEVCTKAENQEMESNRALTEVSRSYYALRNAVMSIPPWPIAALSFVALLALPIAYGIQLVQRLVRPVSQAWTTGLIAILGVGALATLWFAASHLVRQKQEVLARYVRQIGERYELESRPVVHRAMKAVYDAAEEAIARARVSLGQLTKELEPAAMRFERKADRFAPVLQALASPGPFQSAVDTASADRFFRHVMPDPNPIVAELITQIGPLPDWNTRARQAGQPLALWLEAQIEEIGSRFVADYVREYKAFDALADGGLQVSETLERLFGYAYPMWNYDQRSLGRGKTQCLALLGVNVNGSAQEQLKASMTAVRPNGNLVGMEDPHAMVALTVRLGVPLFALRRIDEYRAHYAEALRHSRLPLHTTRSLTLSEDLLPSSQRLQFPPSTLFAAGLAIGVISLDVDGRYIAPRKGTSSLRLNTQKERSVALLSLDVNACREVQRQLDARVHKQGREALQQALDEYMDVTPGLEDWEIDGILVFCRAYGMLNDDSPL